MKKLFVSIAALSMMFMTGCQNEEIVQQTSTGDYTLTLDMGAQSRTLHNENGECVWGENEAIYVVGDGGKVFGKLTMKSKSDDGKKAVFSGKVTGDPGKLQFMVYPVPEADGTIPMGNIDGTNHNAPMTGTISGGVVSGVDYAGGLIQVPVSGVNDVKVNAKGSDGKVVTGGSYTFNPEDGTLTFDPNGGSTVVIENVLNTNGYVYVPVDTDADEDATDPNEQTERVTIEITIGEGNNQQSQSFKANIQEGAITAENVPSIEVNENGEVSTTYLKWADDADIAWYNEENTEFTLDTAEELAGLAKLVNESKIDFEKKTIKLGNDIDLKFHLWTPIGGTVIGVDERGNSIYSGFKGIFDGGNHMITNLFIDGENKSYQGLFGNTNSGEIKNLIVKNAEISGYLNVGVVAGQPYTTKYTNIKVEGHVEVNGFSYVGGVGGKNAYTDWTDITVNVDETSYVKAYSIENEKAYRTYVGGVVGFNGEGVHTFKNIISNINVIGSTCDVGGLFGIAHYGNKFVNCSSSGSVEITDATEAGDAEEMGGIAGVWHNGGADVVFTSCEFTGTLKANITEGVDLSDNIIVGAAYSTTGNGSLVIENEVAGGTE